MEDSIVLHQFMPHTLHCLNLLSLPAKHKIVNQEFTESGQESKSQTVLLEVNHL